MGSKVKQVAEHLEKFKSITSWEAIMRYHATRLSAIIFTLRKRGYIISSKRENNGTICYVRYWYEGKADA